LGLGLAAQQYAVASFLKSECIEIENRKNNNRLHLIGHARKIKVLIAIAKLYRLSRNAAFIFTRKDSGEECTL
jgi:hypothetical protein